MLDLVEQQGTISKSRAAEIQGHLNFAGASLLPRHCVFWCPHVGG